MAHCELGRDCRCPKSFGQACANWCEYDEIPTSPEHPALDRTMTITGQSGMAALLADVRAFHEATDTPVLDNAAMPDGKRTDLRERLLREEVKEFLDALDGYNRGYARSKAYGRSSQFDSETLVEVADALADIIYICVGTALEFGIPLDRVWAEVQRTNMAKVDPATGKALRRPDGKILKPDGWTPPKIAEALGVVLTNNT